MSRRYTTTTSSGPAGATGPTGPAGASGAANTTTAANFTQPAVGSTVQAQVASSSGFFATQFIYIVGGGYYTVSSVDDATHITIKNLGDAANAAAAATVSSTALVYGAGQPKIVATARVATDEASTSTTYADLATVGPSVSIVTGTSVLITMNCNCYSTSGLTQNIWVSFTVSGASTLAADDTRSSLTTVYGITGHNAALASTLLITGLTAGLNAFVLKYRTDSGTSRWTQRNIVVQTIN